MAFIYNLTDSWTDGATTWNGIKLAVTNTSSDATSKLLNLTVTGTTTATFVVDKSGNVGVGTATPTAISGYTSVTIDNATYGGIIDLKKAGSNFFRIGVDAAGNGALLNANGGGSVSLAISAAPKLTVTNAGKVGIGTTTPTNILDVVGSVGLVNGTSYTTTIAPSSSAATNWTLTLPTTAGTAGYVLTTDGSGNTSWAAGGGGGGGVTSWSGGSTGLTPSSATTGAVTLGGTLAIASGGTNNSTAYTAGSIIYSNGTSLTQSNSKLFWDDTYGSLGVGTNSPSSISGFTILSIDNATNGGVLEIKKNTTNILRLGTNASGTGPLYNGTQAGSVHTFSVAGVVKATLSSSGIGLLNSSSVTTTIASNSSTATGWTLTLPTSAGTNGYYLQTDGAGNTTWAAGGGGGGGSPGGSNTQVQFNDSGTFGGDTGFTYNKTTDAVTVGVQQTSQGSLVLANTAAGAYSTTINASNSASVAWTLTLPTTAGSNGQVLTTNGSGVTSWTTVSGGSLTVGTSSISGGVSGRILYDNAGVLGELATIPVANGGTGLTSGTSGGVLYYSATGTLASSAALAASSLVIGGGAGVAPSTITTGTGVTTALGVNTGSAGAFVVNGGALGTPSSGTLTNATGLPISTGVSGLGTGVATFLATPSSANLAAAVTDETGSGSLVFSTAPTFGTNITVGSAASSTGIVNLKGTTSGTVALSVADAAGTWTMKLPTSAGTNGYYLQTDGAGNTTWAAGGGASTLTVGTTSISGGVTGRILYDNAGVLGELATTGSGNVVLATSPTLVTPILGTPTSGTLTSCTGLPLSTGVTGTLPVGNGGTGATTLTGVLKGNGTSAFTAATAGTDYVAPATATTFTAAQTFSGSSSSLAAIFANAAEVATVSATAATGTVTYYVTTQSVVYYTSNASANWTMDFRASSGTTLNAALATGQSVTVAFLVTNGATAYYNNAVQIDGASVTPKWQGGTAPTAGNASSIDVYTYTIIKTASATFTVFASQTKFA